MGKACCNKKCGAIAIGFIGAVVLIVGAIVVVLYGILFEKLLLQEMTIKEGTLMYDTWSVVTTPTYFSFYFYNVTNKDAFLAQKRGENVKAVMEELGPYVFREYLSKDNISFLSDLNPEEVFFRQKSILEFDREKSAGNLDDMITTLNIIGASVAPILEYNLGKILEKSQYRIINKTYNDAGTQLLFTKSVHDLIFGFEDELYTKIVEAFAPIIELPPTFGLFATMNNSQGWFNYQVYTGKDRPDLINVITEYRGMSELPYWGSDYCNMLNGTDGTTTPPFMEQENNIYFFVDDICRSLYGKFTEEVIVKKIPAWKYTIPKEIFEAPLKSEKNRCFCPGPNEPLCRYDGAIPLKTCMAGAPVLASLPHFLNGDEYYLNSVEGVSEPVPEEHEVSLVYEPNTGQAIQVDKRLQINFILRNNPNIDVLNLLTEDVIFPVVWLNESALIGDEDADLMYGLIVTSNEVVAVIQIVLCIVGSILFLVPLTFGFVYYLKKSKKKENFEMKRAPSSKEKYNTAYSNEDEN